MEKKKINTQKYKNLILCYNADGSQNKARTIMEFVKVKLNIRDHLKQIYLVVVKLGKISLFLEVLKKTNKIMKWRTDKSRGEAIEYKEGNLV